MFKTKRSKYLTNLNCQILKFKYSNKSIPSSIPLKYYTKSYSIKQKYAIKKYSTNDIRQTYLTKSSVESTNELHSKNGYFKTVKHDKKRLLICKNHAPQMYQIVKEN